MKERLTAEEILQTGIDKQSLNEICGGQDIWDSILIAMNTLSHQEVDAEIEKRMPNNNMINKTAQKWAKDHSSAPDKDCPEWIVIDYEAGAYFVRQCLGCWNKEEHIKGGEIERWRDGLPSNYEQLKKLCCDFFRYWWNTGGTNTDDGFDTWFHNRMKGNNK